MESNPFEHAIKSDLATLSTMTMGYVSAKDLYGRVFSLSFKLSFLLLAINTGVRLVLMAVGLFSIPFTPGLIISLMVGTWAVCFMASLVLGMVLSRLIILSHLIKGRLKTEAIIKETFKHLSLVCLGIYIGAYTLSTVAVTASFGDVLGDPWLLSLITMFSQGIAFVAATGITGLIAGIEFDRLGLGAVFNILSEMLAKARKSHQSTHLGKDA